MPPRLIPLYARVAASLSDEDRAVVRRWEASLGLPVGGWRHVPPLRDLLFVVAALRLAADMPELKAGEALAEACAALGLPDDSAYDARPADSVARRLRRWAAAAYAEADTAVRSARRGRG